jgi:hypothetical protein
MSRAAAGSVRFMAAMYQPLGADQYPPFWYSPTGETDFCQPELLVVSVVRMCRTSPSRTAVFSR